LDGPFAGLMEKMMSKTKDTEKTRELTEAELNHVSGGKGDRPVVPVYYEVKLKEALVT
jgi:bacteriocin-like protein